MIIKAIRISLQKSWHHKKIWLFFWFLNLLVAVLSLIPYLSSFHTYFQHRLVTYLMARENLYTYYAEFYHATTSVIIKLLGYLSASGILHAWFTMAVSGGIISLFLKPMAADVGQFCRQARRLGWRMTRLGMVLMVLWVIALVVGTVSLVIFWEFLPAGMAEKGYFYALLAGIVFNGLLMLAASMIVDIARIMVTQYDLKKVIPAIFLSVTRFLKHPFRFFVYYLSIFALWSTSILLYWKMQTFITNVTQSGFIMELILLQCFIFFLYGLRFSRYGGLVYLMDLPPRLEGSPMPDTGTVTRLN